MSTDTSNDHDKAASSVTEAGGESEPKYDQEHPHASQSAGSWKEALTGLVSVNSCVLTYMRNCIRLPDVDYEGFLYHADMTQKENCTLQRCKSLWHAGITQLAKSTHSGLQRQVRILLNQ